MRKVWTPQDDEKLRALYKENIPLKEVAARLGLKAHQVYERARRLRLRDRPEGAETVRKAAVRCGFSYEGLVSILTEYGVPLRRTPGPTYPQPWIYPWEADKAVAAWMRTETVRSAHKRLGVSDRSLRRWLEDAGYQPPPRRKVWRLPSEVFDDVVARYRRGPGRPRRNSLEAREGA